MQIKFTIHSLFLSLILGYIFTGCNKQLNLQPENVFTENELVNSPNGALSLLAGAYFSFQNATVAVKDDAGTGALAYVIGDFNTNISTLNPLGFIGEVYNLPYTGGLLSNSPSALYIWSAYYASINLCNILINQLPKSTGVSTSLKTQYIAEAKFVRALNYFNLLKLYGNGALIGNLEGLGVIIRLVEYSGYTPQDNLPRSTNQQVYAQILSDLQSAANTLNNNTADAIAFRSRATKTSCYALAARVALYERNWATAVNFCDSALLDQTNYILEASPYNVFPNNESLTSNIPISNEVIMTLPISYNNNTQYFHYIFYYYKNNIWSDTNFIKTYLPKDIRRDSMFFLGNPGGNTNLVCPTKFSSSNQRDNVVILRLSEVYLNKAEALTQSTQTVTQTAVDLLNAIHQRAFPIAYRPSPYTVASFPTPTALLNAILQERRWELAYEGHDFFDKIRYNQPPNPNLINSNKWVFPIPASDIIFNKNLVQNPGY